MKRQTLIVSLVGLLLVGAAAFGGYTRGVEAGQAQANDIRQSFYGSRGLAQAGGAGAPGAVPPGVRGRDGTVTGKLGEQTAVMSQVPADRSQLQDGAAVSVVAEPESDGTLTARVVTILGQGGPGHVGDAEAGAASAQGVGLGSG